MHQNLRPLSRLSGPPDKALFPLSAEPLALKQIKRADDRGQQVVKVVSDPTGQMTHRVHLLRLSQRLRGMHLARDVAAGAAQPDDTCVQQHRRRIGGYPAA